MVLYLPEIEIFFASLTLYFFGYIFVDFIFKKNIAYDLLFQDRKYYFQKRTKINKKVAGIGPFKKNYFGKLQTLKEERAC